MCCTAAKRRAVQHEDPPSQEALHAIDESLVAWSEKNLARAWRLAAMDSAMRDGAFLEMALLTRRICRIPRLGRSAEFDSDGT